MIGYYIHHVGTGHLHRARSIAAESHVPVVGLSSLPQPVDWLGDWVDLPRDDLGGLDAARRVRADVTANGRLHWVPTGDAGLLARTSVLSAWMARHRPGLVVSDVSSEVALLARLHGIPVATVVLPGRRTDPAHLLGFSISRTLLAAWPAAAAGMLPDLDPAVLDRVQHAGAIARFEVQRPRPRPAGRPRATVLLGTGGGRPSARLLTEARRQSPEWEWTVLGNGRGGWCENPLPALLSADVVVCQGGQNVIAEVAAVGRPAIVVPAERPHDEQMVASRALLAGGWPVVVEETFPTTGWAERLAGARELDGTTWRTWCDGQGAARAAHILAEAHGDDLAEDVA